MPDTEFRFSYTLSDYVSTAWIALDASGVIVEDKNLVYTRLSEQTWQYESSAIKYKLDKASQDFLYLLRFSEIYG